mmetsp:Transcript_38081/g.65061  ORF Transcript_38081/g.65061 Transcript_38081/m.65061 type:complete len:86 (-) Transcript_38081:32-289(-)
MLGGLDAERQSTDDVDSIVVEAVVEELLVVSETEVELVEVLLVVSLFRRPRRLWSLGSAAETSWRCLSSSPRETAAKRQMENFMF